MHNKENGFQNTQFIKDAFDAGTKYAEINKLEIRDVPGQKTGGNDYVLLFVNEDEAKHFSEEIAKSKYGGIRGSQGNKYVKRHLPDSSDKFGIVLTDEDVSTLREHLQKGKTIESYSKIHNIKPEPDFPFHDTNSIVTKLAEDLNYNVAVQKEYGLGQSYYSFTFNAQDEAEGFLEYLQEHNTLDTKSLEFNGRISKGADNKFTVQFVGHEVYKIVGHYEKPFLTRHDFAAEAEIESAQQAELDKMVYGNVELMGQVKDKLGLQTKKYDIKFARGSNYHITFAQNKQDAKKFCKLLKKQFNVQATVNFNSFGEKVFYVHLQEHDLEKIKTAPEPQQKKSKPQEKFQDTKFIFAEFSSTFPIQDIAQNHDAVGSKNYCIIFEETHYKQAKLLSERLNKEYGIRSGSTGKSKHVVEYSTAKTHRYALILTEENITALRSKINEIKTKNEEFTKTHGKFKGGINTDFIATNTFLRSEDYNIMGVDKYLDPDTKQRIYQITFEYSEMSTKAAKFSQDVLGKLGINQEPQGYTMRGHGCCAIELNETEMKHLKDNYKQIITQSEKAPKLQPKTAPQQQFINVVVTPSNIPNTFKDVSFMEQDESFKAFGMQEVKVYVNSHDNTNNYRVIFAAGDQEKGKAFSEFLRKEIGITGSGAQKNVFHVSKGKGVQEKEWSVILTDSDIEQLKHRMMQTKEQEAPQQQFIFERSNSAPGTSYRDVSFIEESEVLRNTGMLRVDLEYNKKYNDNNYKLTFDPQDDIRARRCITKLKNMGITGSSGRKTLFHNELNGEHYIILTDNDIDTLREQIQGKQKATVAQFKQPQTFSNVQNDDVQVEKANSVIDAIRDKLSMKGLYLENPEQDVNLYNISFATKEHAESFVSALKANCGITSIEVKDKPPRFASNKQLEKYSVGLGDKELDLLYSALAQGKFKITTVQEVKATKPITVPAPQAPKAQHPKATVHKAAKSKPKLQKQVEVLPTAKKTVKEEPASHETEPEVTFAPVPVSVAAAVTIFDDPNKVQKGLQEAGVKKELGTKACNEKTKALKEGISTIKEQANKEQKGEHWLVEKILNLIENLFGSKARNYFENKIAEWKVEHKSAEQKTSFQEREVLRKDQQGKGERGIT